MHRKICSAWYSDTWVNRSSCCEWTHLTQTTTSSQSWPVSFDQTQLLVKAKVDKQVKMKVNSGWNRKRRAVWVHRLVIYHCHITWPIICPFKQVSDMTMMFTDKPKKKHLLLMILIIRSCQILHMVTDIVGPYVMYVLNLTIAQNTLLLLIAHIWGQNSTPMLKYKLQILNLNMFL